MGHDMKRQIHLCLAASQILGASYASAATLNQLASIQIVSNVPFDHQLQAARKLGVHRVRLAAYWGSVESPRGRYTWQSTDAHIKDAIKAGMVPIIVLFGANDAYPSVDGTRGAPPSDGEAMEAAVRADE